MKPVGMVKRQEARDIGNSWGFGAENGRRHVCPALKWRYVMLFHVVLICLDLSLSSLIFALCCLKGHRTLIRSILVSLGQAAQSCIIGIGRLNESHHVFSSWSWCGFVVPNLKWLFMTIRNQHSLGKVEATDICQFLHGIPLSIMAHAVWGVEANEQKDTQGTDSEENWSQNVEHMWNRLNRRAMKSMLMKLV